MFLNETIRSVIHAVLIFAVGLFCCMGSSYTIEVNHDHAHSDEHCSSHHLTCDYSTDHAHAHGDEDSDHQHDDESEHDGNPHSRSHSHSHTVSIDLPAACLVKFPSTHFAHMARFSYTRMSDSVPDGPCYDVIVPPQVS